MIQDSYAVFSTTSLLASYFCSSVTSMNNNSLLTQKGNSF
jgi:hypothetical protein